MKPPRYRVPRGRRGSRRKGRAVADGSLHERLKRSALPSTGVASWQRALAAALPRPQFAKVLDRLKPSDVLIVTKLDRLRRNAMDLRATIARPAAENVCVHCPALGGVDLMRAVGKMTMGVLIAVDESNVTRAEGKTLGRHQH